MKTINEKIKELLLQDDQLLLEVVDGLNSWNGCLEDLQFYENDEYFFETFFTSPMEAVRASHFGEYNFSDDYVKFNGYGNLVTYSHSEMIEEVQGQIDEIVDLYLENDYKLDIQELYDIVCEDLEELEEEEV